MKERELDDFLKFIFELGQLKRTPRSGWSKLGINDPESVAEHSFRTAALGFFLAQLEEENPLKVAGYCLFHDIAETRTLDLDWLAQDYLEKEDFLSSRVVADQADRLPEELKARLRALTHESEESEEVKRIARDADLLDLIFQALEYAQQGWPLAREWFRNTIPSLETESGRLIGEYLQKKEEAGEVEELITWWKGAGARGDRGN